MNLLIAEDDPISRSLLEKRLSGWGLPFVSANDGAKALEIFNSIEINFVITDWMMPEMDGLELVRHIRRARLPHYTYIILLTAKADKADLVQAMTAGADDYITKPFDRAELQVRVQAGLRVLALEENLAAKIRDLEASASHIEALQKLLPICMYCKRIRQDDDYWDQVEHYLAQHTSLQFSHGVCPECLAKFQRGELGPLAEN